MLQPGHAQALPEQNRAVVAILETNPAANAISIPPYLHVGCSSQVELVQMFSCRESISEGFDLVLAEGAVTSPGALLEALMMLCRA